MTTLCYIEKDDSYLMMHRTVKKNDVNKDKWIGVGGHAELGESPEECLLREVKEETGYTLTSWRFRGLVTFVTEAENSKTVEYMEYMCLYTADGFTGEPIACDEGELAWVKKEDVLHLNLWEGDKIFFRLLNEDEPFFSLKLRYVGDTLAEAVLNGKQMELFEERSGDGTPTGTIVERGVAHSEGRCHGTAHIWIARANEKSGCEVLLQKRSAWKDSNPGCYDISSAGHLSAGDTYLEGALREIGEELGIHAEAEELRDLGLLEKVSHGVFYGKPFHDHEVSAVYLYTKPVEAEKLHLQESEVEAVRWMDLKECQKAVREGSIPNCIDIRELEMIEKSTTPYVYNDSNYKRVQYTRYADDFIIGVIGSKADAEAIKKDVKIFLQKALKLEMSDTKTKVTHTGDRARFLGYDITVSRVQTLQKASNGRVQRCQTGVVKLYVPREKWVGKLIEYKAMKIKINENGKERFVALHRGKLVNQSDIEILARYNAEVRGLYNYYTIANDSFKIGRFANVMKYSMYKTFACKYKTNVHEIKRRYCRNELFTVAYETRQGMKTTTFYRDGYKRKECATKFDNVSELPQFSKYAKTNTLKQRVERHTCELCQKDCRNLVIHQVKKLKDLKGNTEWVLLMRKRRRKTLVVCPECHNLIHS